MRIVTKAARALSAPVALARIQRGLLKVVPRLVSIQLKQSTKALILDIEGSGDKAEAVVRFPDVGEKRLLLAWATLVKVG